MTTRTRRPGLIKVEDGTLELGAYGIILAIVLAMAALGLALWLKVYTPGSDYQRLNAVEARITAVERHLGLEPATKIEED